MAEPLGAGAYDGRRSAVRARPERGVEVQVRPVRRRSWPEEDKLRMVRETLQPGVVVQAVAGRVGGRTGELYTRWKGMPAAAGFGFVPVGVAAGVPRGGGAAAGGVAE